ncbi:hypothetical protein BX285_0963 [Streptomyces sp. 1114.5]|uniref:hypothetical protein n=1 Tax=Streptomyces sp. 1114.5 TaxID=1938830 RepID=UPI000EB06618|nr:hypothetical protein [Streptomyces sp. 1114.5]RKT16617.1 hypothetical protein BX285_0963 [Streptomyces sp. 1114.5]
MTALAAAPLPGAPGPAQPVGAAAWDLRLARAVPFALVCTLIAAAGHALAGGGDVPPTALAVGFVAVLGLAAACGGRERSLAGIAGALGAGQLVLHCLFHGFNGHGLGGSMTGMAGMAGMHGGSGPLTLPQVAGRLICNEAHPGTLVGLPGSPSAEQLVSSAGLDPHAYAAAPWWQGGVLGMTPSMLAGHLAAALVAGWWLRRGEAALWRLLRVAASAAREHWAAPLRSAFALVAALLRGLFGVAGPARRFGAGGGESPFPAGAVLRHSVVRRGPPCGAFAH